MKVGLRLKQKLITVSPGDGLELAFQLMMANGIRHLPVVEKNKVVGIISDRDLQGSLILSRKEEAGRDVFFIPPGVKVAEVMTSDPIVITPHTDVEEAARLMYHHRISSLPVVEDGRPVGIITDSDILGIFIEIMGVIESSSRIDVEMDDTPDSLNHAAEIIKKCNGKIISVAMSPPGDDHRRTYYFRLASCDTAPIVKSLMEAGYKIKSAMS